MCVHVCLWVGVCGGLGAKWGPAWASGSLAEERRSHRRTIYLCLRPPGRSDTGGEAGGTEEIFFFFFLRSEMKGE